LLRRDGERRDYATPADLASGYAIGSDGLRRARTLKLKD
jgi:hypothetical protein